MKKAVYNYNNVRTHNHIGKMTPIAFERKCSMENSQQRKTITIFNNEVLT